ncbi:MAG: polysaccharide pyruvyl transferase family protein, partial [Prevotella sp.]|nr:polysaccharide pyruvyl transferase family protein [Prevotella sp.]
YYSDIFITDSFHGCVFAILFHKDFYIMENSIGGNSRIKSLLEILGLEHRLVNSAKSNSTQIINWHDVNEKLSKYRCQSMEYLRKIIEG